MAATLAALLDAAPSAGRIVGNPGVEVTSVTHDSRVVVPGALFCCVTGSTADGHDFAAAAVDRGAVALLCERELTEVTVPQVVVPSTRRAMGPVSAAALDNPSRQLEVAGVTGTAGKTTTVHLLRAVFDAAGRPAAAIGTLTGKRTTPEAPDLQSQLRGCVDQGKQAVAMEVSSHALALFRVDGTWFAVAVFTNLSREHLDFHGSMSEYFQAKARLFTPEFCARAVVNLDDPHGRLLRDAATVPTEGYSLADAADLSVNVNESRFRWRGVAMRVPLGGRLNVLNAVAAATAATQLGVPPDAIAEGLAASGPVPGRFEPIEEGQPFRVLVDYAHKPDGLEQVLAAAREIAGDHRVLVVFGCGGDKDRSKRRPMGEVAARLADRVVVTSDNPRFEDPNQIIAEIVSGVTDRARLTVEPDRRAAIALAVGEARAGDVVVIAGKGHETTLTIGDRELPFDDRVAVREELERLGW